MRVDIGRLVGRRFQAVLFDLDGTLIDSLASARRTWVGWAEGRGIPLQALAGWHGVPTAQILNALIPADEVAAEQARIEAIEIADADGIRVLPGAVGALAALPAGRSAVVTSCTEPLARARIAASGLQPPGLVVTASDVSVGKPDPQPYLLAAHRLGLDPAACLVVEDAPAGLAAGHSAGCATLAVLTTHEADEVVADAVVNTLADVTFVAGLDGVAVGPADGSAPS
jgi:sugar-phosphatase